MDVRGVLAVLVGAGSVKRMLGDSAVSSEPFGIVELHRQIHVRFVVFVRLGALRRDEKRFIQECGVDVVCG